MDRITIPDVLNALTQQTNGELKQEDFLPRGVKASHCSFSSLFVLTEDERFVPISNLSQQLAFQQRGIQSTEESSRRFISKHWRFYEERIEPVSDSCCGSLNPASEPETESPFRRLLTHSLTISCMPFQDVWNIDLQRLKRCCGHVITSYRQIMPFCSLYLTNSKGERLYIGDKNGKMLFRDLVT